MGNGHHPGLPARGICGPGSSGRLAAAGSAAREAEAACSRVAPRVRWEPGGRANVDRGQLGRYRNQTEHWRCKVPARPW